LTRPSQAIEFYGYSLVNYAMLYLALLARY